MFCIRVWIMARGTTDPTVRCIVASAVGQPVRLEANITDAEWPLGRDLRPGAMACPQKVDISSAFIRLSFGIAACAGPPEA